MKKFSFLDKKFAAGVLFILGALLAVSPAGSKTVNNTNAAEMTEMILENAAYISADEVASWIIDRRPDMMIIDIREAAEYDKYHLEGAINIPMKDLFKEESLNLISDEIDVILYSNSSTNAAQAWLLLYQTGVHTYVLQGGMNYWAEAIMNPEPPSDLAADSEILKYQFRKGASGYFAGGTVITSGSTERKPGNNVKKITRKKKKKGGACF